MADVVVVVIVDVIVDERPMNMSSGGTSRACEEVVPVIDVVVVWERTCLRSRWTDVSAAELFEKIPRGKFFHGKLRNFSKLKSAVFEKFLNFPMENL